jgi:hypothetical protein
MNPIIINRTKQPRINSAEVLLASRRQHDTRWTVWNPQTGAGLTFDNSEEARAYAFGAEAALSIVAPLHGNDATHLS